MRCLPITLLMLTLLVLAPAAVPAQDVASPARAAADMWLTLVDQQQYGESWKAAAASFKAAVTEARWQEAAQRARGPLGAFTSRSLKSSTSATSLPGAPDGEYVVMQFNAAFEHKAAAVETVTVVHEPDGAWRVVGYFVR